MQVQPTRIEWPGDQLLAALKLILDEQDFSELKKSVMFRKLKKQHERGQLAVENLDTEWLYRLCCASLMLHEYHWIGWEFRSRWAADVCTKRWIWPRWDGAKRRVAVLGEQGVGDEVLFASCFADFSQDVEEAWIECEPRLLPMYERSFGHLENLHFIDRYLGGARRVVPQLNDYAEKLAGIPLEAYIPCGNIPKLYRRKFTDFANREPHLKADPQKVEWWRQWLGQIGVTTGVSWLGRQGVVPELPALPGMVSLQYGDADTGKLWVPPVNLKWELDEVLALIAALDKVITIPTTVAHLAGALGKPIELIKPPPIFATTEDSFNNRVAWAWPEDYNDWYPNIRIFKNFNAWHARWRSPHGQPTDLHKTQGTRPDSPGDTANEGQAERRG